MRPALDTLCARGPWSGTEDYYQLGAGWGRRAWTLTGDELRAVYLAIDAGRVDPTVAAIGEVASSRKADRALRLLRKAGLIAFVGRRWVRT